MTKLHSHLKKGFISILSLTLILSSLNVYAMDLNNSNIIIEEDNLNESNDLNEDIILIQDDEDIGKNIGEDIDDNISTNEINSNQNDTIDNTSINDIDNFDYMNQVDEIEQNNIITFASSSETSHDCNKYLTTKYDKNQHWQQCSICSKKYNISNHSFSSYWTLGDSCSSSNKLVSTCSCGYSYTTQNTRQHKDVGNYVVEPELYQHAKWCKSCGDRVEYSRCKKSDGSLISCTNLGTCTICGAVYSHAWHNRTVDGITGGDVYCQWCSKKIATISNGKTNYNYSNKILYATNTYRLTPVEANMTNTTTSPSFHLGNWRQAGLEMTSHTYTRNSSNGVIDVTLKIGMTAYYQTKVLTHSQVYNMGYNDGSTARILVQFSMKPDITAPIISSVTSSDVFSKNLGSVTWSTGKKITIKGTEEYSQSVVITFKDSKGSVLSTGTTNVVNNNYSYTFTPDIEAGTSGANYTIIVADKLGNSTSKTLTFYRVDKKAPIITSSNTSATNWTKSKTMTFLATDAGVGNVKFGIDSTSYENSKLNNNVYSISKTFNNDVYGNKNITIYAKDAFDNTSSQTFTISNIDNTSPTITKVESSKALGSTSLTVTANDINTTLNKSGSGVSKYIITSSSSTPSENDSNWQTSNILKVTTPGTYYIFAKDLVGNISNAYKVDVKVNYTLSVNPNGGSWNNSSSTQEFTITNGDTKTISNPSRTGYTFKNWTLSGTNAKFENSTFTMGNANASLVANWNINQYNVTYIDVVGSTSGTQLGKTTKKVNYNSTVRGSDLGSNTSDNAYYNGYYYSSDTSATVSTSGATVYRIFKLRTIDKTSNLTWNDNNNKNGFRPSKYTLKLMRNGDLFKQVELTSSQTSYTFSDLTKYDNNGKEYKYTFQVDASDRYKIILDSNGNTIIENYQNSTFSVTIPKTISLNGLNGKGNYNVKVNGTFYYNDTLTVTPSNSFTLKDKNNINSLQANVTQNVTTFTKNNLGTTSGSISLNKTKFAGKYDGTFNFNIKFTLKN